MDEVAPAKLFELLADEYAREILAQANCEPMSARQLAAACNAHHSTIYRRIEELENFDLLIGQQRLDPEDGHHFTVYRTTMEEITVHLDRDQYVVALRRTEDPIDRMATMWRQLRGEEG